MVALTFATTAKFPEQLESQFYSVRACAQKNDGVEVLLHHEYKVGESEIHVKVTMSSIFRRGTKCFVAEFRKLGRDVAVVKIEPEDKNLINYVSAFFKCFTFRTFDEPSEAFFFDEVIINEEKIICEREILGVT